MAHFWQGHSLEIGEQAGRFLSFGLPKTNQESIIESQNINPGVNPH